MPIVYDPILWELETDPVPWSSWGWLANPVLEELHNVVIQDAAPWQVLQYDGSVWRNVTMAIAWAVLLYASVLAAAPTAVEAYFPTEQVSHYDPVDPASPTVIEARYPAEQVSYYDPVTESTPSLITAYVPPEQAIAYWTVTFPPPPEPPAQEFIIKEFTVDDRYADWWTAAWDMDNGQVYGWQWWSTPDSLMTYWFPVASGITKNISYLKSNSYIETNVTIPNSGSNYEFVMMIWQIGAWIKITSDNLIKAVLTDWTERFLNPVMWNTAKIAMELSDDGTGLKLNYIANDIYAYSEAIDPMIQTTLNYPKIYMVTPQSNSFGVDYVKYKFIT